jgi:hypothetical protein
MLEDKRCLIGSPCFECIESCGYHQSHNRDNGQDEKENENERISKGNEEGNQLYSY